VSRGRYDVKGKMINWWLILLIVVIPLLSAAVSVYILFYFQSDVEMTNSLIFPKVVFCFSMVLSTGVVLLVPFDAANSPDPTLENTYSDTLNTQLMWEIVIWIMALFVVLICPFTTFYYEAFDPEKPDYKKQLAKAGTITGVILLVLLIGSLIGYTQASDVSIEFYAYIANPQTRGVEQGVTYQGTYTKEKFKVGVTYQVYLLGLLCVVGWVAFLLYGGVGMAAYPINSLRDFMSRPKRLSAAEFADEMGVVLSKSEALMTMCEELMAKARGKSLGGGIGTQISILRNEAVALEDYQDRLIYTFVTLGGSPFLVYGELALGVLCLLIGIFWIIHIFVYNTFDLNPFLNSVLTTFYGWFPLLGIAAYSVFSFYLMWATFNGQIALGLRLVFFQIYPMKKHDTLINALLFNGMLQMLTSIAVVEFIARSFRDFAPLSSINGLMNVYIRHLDGIGYIVNWAEFLIIAVALLSVIWLVLCPRKTRKGNDDPRMLNFKEIR